MKGQLWEPIMCCIEVVQDRKIRNSHFFFSLESIGNSNLPKQSKIIIVSVCRGGRVLKATDHLRFLFLGRGTRILRASKRAYLTARHHRYSSPSPGREVRIDGS
jgi:hypothetical protein